jgi:hypothetical protein
MRKMSDKRSKYSEEGKKGSTKFQTRVREVEQRDREEG